MEDLHLTTAGHYLDRTDPDVVVLRRRDGSFLAAFSAVGMTREAVLHAAEEDQQTGPGLPVRAGEPPVA